MSSFTTPLVVEYTDGEAYKIMQAFDYYVTSPEEGDLIRVPAGFVTDFASIPRIFWNILPPTGKYGKAAVIHDYIYVMGGKIPHATKVYTKLDADNIFRDAMQALGVNWFVRNIMYRAVRLGGRGNF